MFKFMKDFCEGFKEGVTGQITMVEEKKDTLVAQSTGWTVDSSVTVVSDIHNVIDDDEPVIVDEVTSAAKTGEFVGKVSRTVLIGAGSLCKKAVKLVWDTGMFVLKAPFRIFMYVIRTIRRYKRLTSMSYEWMVMSQGNVPLSTRTAFIFNSIYRAIVTEIKYGLTGLVIAFD